MEEPLFRVGVMATARADAGAARRWAEATDARWWCGSPAAVSLQEHVRVRAADPVTAVRRAQAHVVAGAQDAGLVVLHAEAELHGAQGGAV